MSLRIRQIVLAARDLGKVVAQLTSVLGVEVCYHDPEVGKFGLRNALMTIGHKDFVQFLEVVSPIEDNTTAGRHLDRHGDSGYMLILQSDDLARDRARFEKLNVRIVWQATHPDISAVHLHPKDIGGAIVSIDQPLPPRSWRWAGPNWKKHVRESGAQQVHTVSMAARDASAMAKRWAEVLGMPNSESNLRIEIEAGQLQFASATVDVIAGFGIAMSDRARALVEARKQGLPVNENTVTICGTEFQLTDA
jgi:Glyoxalase-like domain